MSIVDTIARTAARIAKPPSREAEGAMHELIERQELATIARVYGDACEACRFHGRTHRVPCLKHTPASEAPCPCEGDRSRQVKLTPEQEREVIAWWQIGAITEEQARWLLRRPWWRRVLDWLRMEPP